MTACAVAAGARERDDAEPLYEEVGFPRATKYEPTMRMTTMARARSTPGERLLFIVNVTRLKIE